MSGTASSESNTMDAAVDASWRALLDPRPFRPADGTSPREFLAVIDGGWADDDTAWQLATRLLRYAALRRGAHVEGVSPGATTIAYATALGLYNDVRCRRVSATVSR